MKRGAAGGVGVLRETEAPLTGRRRERGRAGRGVWVWSCSIAAAEGAQADPAAVGAPEGSGGPGPSAPPWRLRRCPDLRRGCAQAQLRS